MSIFFLSTVRNSSTNQSPSFSSSSSTTENLSRTVPKVQNDHQSSSIHQSLPNVLFDRTPLGSPDSQASHPPASPASSRTRSCSVVDTSQFCNFFPSLPPPPSQSLTPFETAMIPASKSQTSSHVFNQAERMHQIREKILTPRSNPSSSCFTPRQNPQTHPFAAPSPHSYSSSAPTRRDRLHEFQCLKDELEFGQNQSGNRFSKPASFVFGEQFAPPSAPSNSTSTQMSNFQGASTPLNPSQLFALEIPPSLSQEQISPPSSSSQKPIGNLDSALNEYKAKIDKLDTSSSVEKAFHDFLVSTIDLPQMFDDRAVRIWIDAANDATYSVLRKKNMSPNGIITVEKTTKIYNWIKGKFADPEITNQIKNSHLRQVFKDFSDEQEYEDSNDFATDATSSDSSDSDYKEPTRGASSSSGRFPSRNKKKNIESSDSDSDYKETSKGASSSSGRFPSRNKKKNIESSDSDSDYKEPTKGASSSSGRFPSRNIKRKKPAKGHASDEDFSDSEPASISTRSSKRRNVEIPLVSISNPVDLEEVPPEFIVKKYSNYLVKDLQIYLLKAIETQESVKELDEKILTKSQNPNKETIDSNVRLTDILKKTKSRIKSRVETFINQFPYAKPRSIPDEIKCIKLAGYFYNWFSKKQFNDGRKFLFSKILRQNSMQKKLEYAFGNDLVQELLEYFRNSEKIITQNKHADGPQGNRRIPKNPNRRARQVKIYPPISLSEIPPHFVTSSKSSPLFNKSLYLRNLAIKILTQESNQNSISKLKKDIRKEVTKVIDSLKTSPFLDKDLIGYIRYARKIYNLCHQFQRTHLTFNKFLSETTLAQREIFEDLLQD